MALVLKDGLKIKVGHLDITFHDNDDEYIAQVKPFHPRVVGTSEPDPEVEGDPDDDVEYEVKPGEIEAVRQVILSLVHPLGYHDVYHHEYLSSFMDQTEKVFAIRK